MREVVRGEGEGGRGEKEGNGKGQNGEWNWVRAEGKTSYAVKWNHQTTSLRSSLSKDLKDVKK